VAFVVAATLAGTLGCHAAALPTIGPRAVPSEALHGPPAPGIRLPGWLPRGELFWDGAARYRLFDRPRIRFEDGVPDVSLTDEPLIAGRFGVKLQVDAAGFVERGGLESVPDDVQLRRAFLTSRGTLKLLHPVQYNLEFGLLEESFYLDSAWLRWRDVPWVGAITLGGLDAPLGFDNLVSSRDRIFMEVPAPVQAFVPATSVGIEAARTHHDGRGTWALGWFTVGQRRDVGDQSRALARVAGRTTWLLRAHEDEPSTDRWPELLHVGVAGAYTFAGTDHVHYQARPESFLAPIAVDTAHVESRSAFVLGVEAAGRRGPLSFQGEYLQAFVDRASVSFPGLYLTVAYLLSGEIRPYDRESAVFGQLVPARPLDLRARRFGAFECAARWSWVDLDDGPIDGGRMHVLGAGFNWYWNRWVRWQVGYELAFVDGGRLDGRLHVFQGRFQLVL
jgi:phosphate-selective porin OprO/OprP